MGGNRKAKDFLESQSDYSPSMSVQQKYNTKAAALYRDKISALAEGRSWSIDTSPARFYEPKEVSQVSEKYAACVVCVCVRVCVRGCVRRA